MKCVNFLGIIRGINEAFCAEAFQNVMTLQMNRSHFDFALNSVEEGDVICSITIMRFKMNTLLITTD
jgi:hypothetical protein